jgi:uncharacterized protein with FMN-binding domain
MDKLLKAKHIRFAIQLLFFILLPSVYIQAFAGIRGIFESIINFELSDNLTYNLPYLIAVIPTTMILGRFFCGWMCAFGSFLDFVNSISKKFIKKKYKIGEKTDLFLKSLKYLILITLAAFAWTMSFDVFNKISPWDSFGMIFSFDSLPDFSNIINLLPAATIIFVAIIILSAFYERFFCKYLCPLGAIFSITSLFRVGRIVKPIENCKGCTLCTKNCPVNIPLYKMDEVKSGECINCMKCVTSCPRKNAHYELSTKELNPYLISGISLAMISSSYYTSYALVGDDSYNPSSILSTLSQDNKLNCPDGTYTGTGYGFRGELTLSITVKDGLITDINTVSSNEDYKFYERAFSGVTDQIISSQSADVDAVSGATYSSNGIMEAVNDAISNASISVEITTESTTDSTEKVTLKESSTTEKTTTEATTTEKATTEATTEAATTTEASDNPMYKDGEYTGSAYGFKSNISISVTISNGKIESIETVSGHDDKKFYDRAFSKISAAVVSSQDADVDAVSGATYSSNGIIDAVKEALSQASNN